MPFTIPKDSAQQSKQTERVIRLVNWLLTIVALATLSMLATIVVAEWDWITDQWKGLEALASAAPDVAFALVVFVAGSVAAGLSFGALRIRAYFSRQAQERTDRWAKLADPKDLPKLENDSRVSRVQLVVAIGQMASSAVLIAGIYFSWRNLQISRANLESAIEGQNIDRFSKAVEMLSAQDKAGGAEMQTRQAGINILIRISQSSSSDYDVVRKTLMAYVRQNLTVTPKALRDSLVSNDVQDVLSFLTTRSFFNASLDFTPIDLSNLNLKGVILPHAFLEGSILFNVDLEKSMLRFANFSNADLRAAHLNNALLAFASLRDADLLDADLSGADLSGANLYGARLEHARLEGAYLQGANLEGAEGLDCEQIVNASGDSSTRCQRRSRTLPTAVLEIADDVPAESPRLSDSVHSRQASDLNF
jgi:uncharacterized protein YjbI with pentapeptide repeats